MPVAAHQQHSITTGDGYGGSRYRRRLDPIRDERVDSADVHRLGLTRCLGPTGRGGRRGAQRH
jgi:hypothetical protein